MQLYPPPVDDVGIHYQGLLRCCAFLVMTAAKSPDDVMTFSLKTDCFIWQEGMKKYRLCCCF